MKKKLTFCIDGFEEIEETSGDNKLVGGFSQSFSFTISEYGVNGETNNCAGGNCVSGCGGNNGCNTVAGCGKKE